MGFWDAVASTIEAATNNSRIDRFARELGWSIDERHGKTIGLYFHGDSVTPRRTVYAVDSGSVIGFFARCRAEFSEHNLPRNLLGAMLVHNKDVTLGAWHAALNGGVLTLVLEYTALALGVDAAAFKLICTALANEVATIETKLYQEGLL